MFKWLVNVFGTVGAAIRCRHDLAAENLALRQQLAVMKSQHARPRLTDVNRHARLTRRRRRIAAADPLRAYPIYRGSYQRHHEKAKHDRDEYF